MKLLSFFEMSEDKLSIAISSNHQYLGGVLIDWTNSYHFRKTHIKGSTPFPFQTSFLSFSIFLSFLSDPTLVFIFFFSLSLFSHPLLLFLSQGTLVFCSRGEHFSPKPTPLFLDSASNMSYRKVPTRVFSSSHIVCL